ncbi:MAG: hypothetical protein H9533_17375 [Rhodobacteraceae bacterium]|nr:hypothetical protein [Paracoccaceae bacterium]
MKRLSGGAMALLLLCAPLPAVSQGMEPLSFSGEIEFEHTRRNGASNTLGSADLMLRYEGPVGFELGGEIDENLETGADASLPFLAVTFGVGLGEVALGAPQPVADTFIDLPDFAGIREQQIGFEARTTSVATGLAKSLGEQIYGARFTAETGMLRYGASIHQITHQSGTHWQVAGEYEAGIDSQIEGVIEGEDGNLGITLGAAHTSGQFDMGLYLISQRIVGSTDAAVAYVGVSVNDALTVRGHLRTEDGTVSNNLIGVEAEYGFSNGAFAQFGAADGNNTSMTVDASVGFKF